MNEELKPCPFCGGKAKLHSLNDTHYVDCDMTTVSICKVIPKTWEYDTKEEAINAWNTRKGEKQNEN